MNSSSLINGAQAQPSSSYERETPQCGISQIICSKFPTERDKKLTQAVKL